MIVTFKSKAAGDVIMFGDVAQQLMKTMGKDADAKGIITPEQLPAAITALKSVIEAGRSQSTESAVDEEKESQVSPMARNVTMAQRAVPLLELLEWSLKKNTPVTWGA
ncbi:MAG TPA: DUF1840 domain-containing protein [Rhodocyclaceae bacterium]|jgi:hypothetical protein|nr:DUF1840 domain-containing protein [Rhodocyclaceae bacterium]